MDNHGFTKDDLKELAERLLEMHTIAKQHGIFTYDRALLECETCQLAEDIAFDGSFPLHWRERYT
jgi:hypothetical protein